MVLESPHRDEYKDHQKPVPANGQTGRNIRRYLPCIPHVKEMGLVLLNAIPYQCSLGEKDRAFRDRIFSEIWQQGGKTCFESRLRGTFSNGDVVLNCCTKIVDLKSEKYLRELIDEVILGVELGCPVIRRSHSVNWRGKLGAEWEPRSANPTAE
jgi:hypothetical protein